MSRTRKRLELDLEALKQESRKVGVAVIAGGLLNWLFLNNHVVNGLVAVLCGIVMILAGSLKEVNP